MIILCNYYLREPLFKCGARKDFEKVSLISWEFKTLCFTVENFQVLKIYFYFQHSNWYSFLMLLLPGEVQSLWCVLWLCLATSVHCVWGIHLVTQDGKVATQGGWKVIKMLLTVMFHCTNTVALFPGLHCFFCSFVCVQYSTLKWKNGKIWGRPENTCHMNDVRWMWGGHRGWESTFK